MKRSAYAFALLCASAACTPMDSGDDSYYSIHDWYCLGTAPVMADRVPGRIQYTVPVVDFDSQLYAPTPIAGAQLTVCTSAACTEPFTDWHQLDSGSPLLWSLDLPYGLSNAVLRFTAPGYVPMDYVLGGPMIGNPVDGSLVVKGIGIPLLHEEALSALYGEVGLGAFDPSRGVFAVRVLDCNGSRAPDATLSASAVSPGSVPFSLSNGNLASANSSTTDARGVAGIMNLLPNTFDVSALSPGGEMVARPTTVNIRPGVVTLAEIRVGLDQWGQ
jgi:hypothetical protein